jgi:hypothetical protein
MIAWTIKGEAGKAFDETVRSLEAAKIESAQVAFNSLADDTFTFSISPEAIPSATIPELKQQMTLYRAGVQFFTGTVTNVRSNIDSSSQQVQITVSGPWWWMERIGFTTNLQDGMGNTGERLSAVFAASATLGQDLKTSIESAINRAVVLGVPIANIAGGSSVAAMTVFPRITLNQSTIGQVLSELVRLVPDTMVYFDYSTSPVKLHVVRRPTATEVTFNASTDPITSIDINPIIDLEVSRVDLPYVTRSTDGRTVFNRQTSGTGTNEKRQVLTMSGPELDTFLPNYKYDQVTLAVSSLSSSGALSIVKTALGITIDTAHFGYDSWTLWDTRPFNGTANYASSNSFSKGANYLTSSSTGAILSSSYQILTTTTIPSWITTPVIDAKLNGFLIWEWYYDQGYGTTSSSPPTAWSSQTSAWPTSASGYEGYSAYYSNPYVRVRVTPFSISVKATLSTGGTVYAPADYSFIFPPTGLSAFLVAAQNWLPYEGSINLVSEDVGATRYRGCKINISNSSSQFATMGALVASEVLDIQNGSTTINLGPAPRNDYRTIVDKIRKTSQDNIVYI